MSSTVRRLALTGALVAALAAPTAAVAQNPFDGLPGVTQDAPDGVGSRPTPTPTPTATPVATSTATATPAATAEARPGRTELPNTGSDALTLALAGTSLLAFGASLRLHLALRDGRI